MENHVNALNQDIDIYYPKPEAAAEVKYHLTQRELDALCSAYRSAQFAYANWLSAPLGDRKEELRKKYLAADGQLDAIHQGIGALTVIRRDFNKADGETATPFL